MQMLFTQVKTTSINNDIIFFITWKRCIAHTCPGGEREAGWRMKKAICKANYARLE